MHPFIVGTAADVAADTLADIVKAAKLFAQSTATLSLYCQGLNQSVNGTNNNAALINLHLATAHIGKPGAGPLSLTGQALQAWMTGAGLSLATIGFLSLVGLPYTFKFLWAPLMDRFDPPLLGRRKGWLVLTQLALAGVLLLMADTSPKTSMKRSEQPLITSG